MLPIETIAEALVNPQATVESVARPIGPVGERRSSEIRVGTTDASIKAVSIGFPKGGDLTAVPDYVQIYFAADAPALLTHVIPSCKHWKQIPNTPEGSPFLYSCRFERSTAKIEVVFLATLTAAIDDPTAHLHDLLLQRNAW